MIRDGVCDEKANVAKCLYDGGDCCKENKDENLCRDCKCILEVNKDDMVKKLLTLDIKPVGNPGALEAVIGLGGNTDQWTVEVQNVVSVEVCSVLCLNHKNADELNAWHYLLNERICRCGWVESKYCPEKMTLDHWTIISDQSNDTVILEHSSFVQLNKTVPCGMCYTFFFILNRKQNL